MSNLTRNWFSTQVDRKYNAALEEIERDASSPTRIISENFSPRLNFPLKGI